MSRTRLFALTIALGLAASGAAPAAQDDHLLLTEVAVTPETNEFIEIANPTAQTVLLDDYYLADTGEYASLPGAFGQGLIGTLKNVGRGDSLCHAREHRRDRLALGRRVDRRSGGRRGKSSRV